MGVLIQSSYLAAVAAPGTGLQCSCPGASRYFILISAVYLDLHMGKSCGRMRAESRRETRTECERWWKITCTLSQICIITHFIYHPTLQKWINTSLGCQDENTCSNNRHKPYLTFLKIYQFDSAASTSWSIGRSLVWKSTEQKIK